MRDFHKSCIARDVEHDEAEAARPCMWRVRTNLDATIAVSVSERMGLQMNGEILASNRKGYRNWIDSFNL